MSTVRATRQRAWAGLALGVLLCASGAVQAQEHFRHDHEFREHEFHDHRYFDARYHHDHYYPPAGFVFSALPAQHHVVIYGGVQFYFAAGVWYRFAPSGGYVVVAPPIGVVVPALPEFYSMLWVGGVPYYYANNVYYVQGPQGYTVAAPPPPNAVVEQPPSATASMLPAAGETVAALPPRSTSGPKPDDIFAYPTRGQSTQQQASDRSDCYRWAVGQTGFDPSASSGQPGTKAPDFQRAMTACLEGRGYTVR